MPDSTESSISSIGDCEVHMLYTPISTSHFINRCHRHFLFMSIQPTHSIVNIHSKSTLLSPYKFVLTGGWRRGGGDCGNPETKSCRAGSRSCSQPSRRERGRNGEDHDGDNAKDSECWSRTGDFAKKTIMSFSVKIVDLCITTAAVDYDGAEFASAMMLIVLRKAWLACVWKRRGLLRVRLWCRASLTSSGQCACWGTVSKTPSTSQELDQDISGSQHHWVQLRSTGGLVQYKNSKPSCWHIGLIPPPPRHGPVLSGFRQRVKT